MDLRWSADDLAWGERLRERLSRVALEDRPDLWTDAGIAAAVLPSAERLVARPPRAMIAMQALGGVLAAQVPAETLVMAAHLLAAADGGVVPADHAGDGPIAVAWLGRGTSDPFFVTATPAASGYTLSGVAPLVADADSAGEVLMAARSGLEALIFRLPLGAPGVSKRSLATIDGSNAAELTFDAVRVEAERLVASGEPVELAMRRGIAVATALACARACGMMRYLVDATADYLRCRRQFGRPLAEFQVLQHRTVNMLIETELAEAATLRALLSFELGEADQARAVAAAKVTASNSARFVGQSAIQLHGGRGMDARTPATQYFRALTALEYAFGQTSWHLERLAVL